MLELTKQISEDVDSFYEILEENYSSYNVGAEKLCATLFKQIRDLFHAVLLLCQSGLVNEAKILARSVIEVSAYLLFISDDNQEERAELYMHSQNLSLKIAVDEFNSDTPPGESKVDDSFYKKAEEEALEYFRKKHGQDKSDSEIRKNYTIKPRDCANQLKNGDVKKIFNSFFTKFYRPTSALTHGQAALQLVRNEGGKLKFKKEPSRMDVCVCLESVSVLTLYVLDNLNQFLKMNKDLIISSANDKVSKLFDLVKREQ